MKRTEAISNTPNTGADTSNHSGKFTKARDGRNLPIRGLWVRNGRYYAQLSFEDANTGEKKTSRIPLTDKEGNPVGTVAQARDAMNLLRVQRAEDNLPVLKRTPFFRDFYPRYLQHVRAGMESRKAAPEALHGDLEGVKAESTIDKEEIHLKKWSEHMGGVRLDKIRAKHIAAYRDKRLESGRSNRTWNLDLTILNNCLHYAIDQGEIGRLPTENVKRLRTKSTSRPLLTAQDVERFCAAAMESNPDGSPVTKNAVQFCDYIRFLAATGAREKEALRVRWKDVSFTRDQVIIGANADTKNNEARIVDFNASLKAHLLDMQKRYAGVSEWLFPSPQRGKKDIPAKSFRESLKLVRKQAGMEHIAFHDFRHHFISYAVMSGIDYMTISRWAGHRDGGVLIGKVYGHLADDHRKRMAEKLNFTS